MELDEEVNEKLKMQFKTLQEQQQKRMQNLMEKKREKLHSQQKKKGRTEAFGIQDDLGLSTLDYPVSKEDIGKRLLEDENEQLQHQLREIVDENGRLYKLLNERDFEIKQLHKKIEDERLALLGTSGLKGDVAAAKIVELAKRNRHMSAEIESEKTKVKRLSNKVKELEKELQLTTDRLHSLGDKESQTVRKTTEGPLSPEIKALQEKLTAANFKVSEYRNQLQTAKQELKMTQKVLASEVGEDVNIQNLLAGPGSWRGRAQQVLVLQGKVRELESQLNQGKRRTSESREDEGVLGLTDSRKKSAQEKNQQRIRSLEKEKKEALEKITGDYNTLQKEFEDVKKRLDGSRARNKVLTNEVKTLKEQISTLLDKGKHDDELIDALLSQQKEMQVILKNLSQQDEKSKESHQSLGNQMNVELQKQNCLIEQLRKMVAEREARVKELEEKVEKLTPQSHLRRTEENSSDSVSTLSAESLEEENYPSVPRSSDHTGSNRVSQVVSKMGHTLVGTAPTSGAPERIVEAGEVDVKALKVQITEYKALCQAAEVEKDRLLELVSILQKRVDDSVTKVWEAEKKLQEQHRKCMTLEQQFKRLKEEPGKSTGPAKPLSKSKAQPHSGASQRWNAGDRKDLSTQLSEVPLESQIEELSTRLAIQMDDNEGLKGALEETMKSKEEDFRVYQETVGQVKKIFLQALRQQKQDMN